MLTLIIFFSPVATQVIGGPQATPLLSKWKWFSITLCTTLATGILLWGAAEPLYHLFETPEGLGLSPNSREAGTFAMSTMLMHWTITPYSIYTISSLLFALMFYNRHRTMDVSALLFPALGSRSTGKITTLANVLCLFALTAGMAASLGSGILTLSGGLRQVWEFSATNWTNLAIGLTIVITFTLSAISGLLKGIKILSDFNIKLFILLVLIVFIWGVPYESLQIGLDGLKDYGAHFVQRNLLLDGDIDRDWSRSWTIFYWANWIAWTPITAIFLGRIARGYTVRQFIIFNLILPSIFSGLWMVVFSGATIHHSIGSETTLWYDEMLNQGPGSTVFQLIETIPLDSILSILFVFITFLSFVTAADSNTTAMSSISTKNLHGSQSAPIGLKIVWGCIIGVSAIVMINFAGIDGIKMLSTIGGFPALLLIIMICWGAIRLLINPTISQYRPSD